MDVFHLRDQLIEDYRSYVSSFMAIRDARIRERVETSLTGGLLWPEPRIGLNPAFEPGPTLRELERQFIDLLYARRLRLPDLAQHRPSRT